MVNIVQFPNVRSVLSQGNTRLRLFYLLYDIEMMWRKTVKHAFSMFYPLIKHGFSTLVLGTLWKNRCFRKKRDGRKLQFFR